MTDRPTAAPPHFPFHEHRTMAEVKRDIFLDAIGDDLSVPEAALLANMTARQAAREWQELQSFAGEDAA